MSVFEKLKLYRYSLLAKVGALATASVLLTWGAYDVYSSKVKEAVFREKAKSVANFSLSVIERVSDTGIYTQFGRSNSVGVLRYTGELLGVHGKVKEAVKGEVYYKYGVNLLSDFLTGYNSIGSMQVHLVSDRPMDPKAFPIKIEKKYIDYFKVHRNEPYAVTTYKGSYYFFMPLYATTLCLKCHGKNVPPERYALLKEKYGKNYERATNYSEGDLIGLLSISAPEESVEGVELPITSITIYLAGLFVLLLGFYYLVVRRITALRDVLRQVTKGKLNVKVGSENLQGVNVADEITQVEQDVLKLKNSIQVALKRRRK